MMTENTKATSAEKESPWSWRAALLAGSVSSMPSPWVVIHQGSSLTFSSIDVNSAASCSGRSSFTPQTTICNSGLRCVGTSGGWLALADVKSTPVALALHNPLAHQVVPLPPLPHPRRNGTYGWFTEGPIVQHTVCKLAFSVSTRHGYTAAVLHRCWPQMQGLELAFTKAGWDCWRRVEMMPYISGEDEHFDLACHVNDDGNVLYYVMTPCWVWLLDKKGLAPLISIRELQPVDRIHMVLSDDGILHRVVMRTLFTGIKVIVERYDPAGCPSSPWKPVTDLAGRSFLVARHGQSLSVSPTSSSPSWLRPDSVYLIVTNFTTVVPKLPPLWRFHVVTDTIECLLQDSHGNVDWANTIWFTPSFV